MEGSHSSFHRCKNVEETVAAFQYIVSYRFFFFTNLQRFLDVCVIWRWVQICVCRRGKGKSCWKNRSRKPFLLSPLHSSPRRRDLGGEGRPYSPAARGQSWRSGGLCSAPETPAVVCGGRRGGISAARD